MQVESATSSPTVPPVSSAPAKNVQASIPYGKSITTCLKLKKFIKPQHSSEVVVDMCELYTSNYIS